MSTNTGALHSHNGTNGACKVHVSRVKNLAGILKITNYKYM
jgi:hypothetical protein